jgi:hypothetical protein
MYRVQYAYVKVEQMRQLSKSSMKSLFTTQGTCTSHVLGVEATVYYSNIKKY